MNCQKIKQFYYEIFIQNSTSFDSNKFYLNSPPGLNRLKAYFWTVIVSSKTMQDWRDKFGKATPLARLWRKIAFPPQMRPGYDFFDFYLNRKHINFLRTLRNHKKSSSQRYIATAFAERFSKTNVQPESQYDGRWLCLYVYDLTGDSNFQD